MRIGGKKVVDATKPLHITISARDAETRDAENGKNKNPAACAAALAIVRGYRPVGVKGARVHLGRVYVEYPDRYVRYKTPQALRAEIVSFDRGSSAEFMQGDYYLGAIPPRDRLGVRSERAKSMRTSPKRVKRAIIRHVIEGVRARGANR